MSTSGSGPSGRSPFPAGRRTRMARTLESTSNDESSHSPFLQGLLRFSPNNASNTTNHWSPVAASSGRFFGGSSFTNGNMELDESAVVASEPTSKTPRQPPLSEESLSSSPPKAVVDGIPLEKLRSLAEQSYESPSQATFYASLVYAKTAHPNDALQLAQVHLRSKNFSACLKLLEESSLLRSNNPWEALLVACAALAAQEEWPSLVELLEDACRLPDDTNQNTHPTFGQLAISRPLDDTDGFAWHSLQRAIDRQQSSQKHGIHLLARICTWRGTAYLETGHRLRAAVYWKKALSIDCQCQAAWEHLLDRHLVSASEAYELLESLDFGGENWLKALYLARIEAAPQEIEKKQESQSHPSVSLFSPNASAIPMASPNFQTPSAEYGVALSKIQEKSEFPAQEGASEMQKAVDGALDQLWNEHKLQNSPHVLAMAARRAYRRYEWKEALEYCERLAQIDPSVSEAAFCYISALVLMGHKRVLFRRAHEWVEFAPKSAQAWFAVGAYYYSCQRYHVAQRHFCRATRLDPQCTEAWVAFGCSFAACDESDQALASFRAAQRLSPGEHTSLLYMGMEYVRTNHLVLAQHFLHSALKSSGGDPLCLHELGVLYAQKGENATAIEWFERALASIWQSDKPIMEESLDLIQDPYWEPTLFTLGHCYRKTRQFDKAEACYNHAIALCPEKSSTYAALAFTKHMAHKLSEAVELYHKALSLKADDPFSTEMLQRALQEHAADNTTFDDDAKPAPASASFLSPQQDDETSGMMLSMDMDMSDSRGTP